MGVVSLRLEIDMRLSLNELEQRFEDTLTEGVQSFNVAAHIAGMMIETGADRRVTLDSLISIMDIVTSEADKLRALLAIDREAAP